MSQMSLPKAQSCAKTRGSLHANASAGRCRTTLRIAFRKKTYRSLEDLQDDLDAWLRVYNEERPHQGRCSYGKTPMPTFLDSLPLAREKLLVA